jgi:hypothetical protein
VGLLGFSDLYVKYMSKIVVDKNELEIIAEKITSLLQNGNKNFTIRSLKPTYESYDLNKKERIVVDYVNKTYEAVLLRYMHTVRIEDDKHVRILKATILGLTEFILRYTAWLATKDNELAGSQVAVVTGLRIDLAEVLIARVKNLFIELEKQPGYLCNGHVEYNAVA